MPGQTINIHEYADVEAVWSAAIEAGGAKYKLETKSAAVRWRFRAYYYRKLLRDLEQERLAIPGHRPRTKFDGWTIRYDKKDPSCLWIEPIKPQGQLTTLDGQPLEPEPISGENEDELLAKVRLDLGLEE